MRTLLNGRSLAAACLGLLAVVPGPTGASDDKPAPARKPFDQRVSDAVLDVLTHGVALHNGDLRRGIRPNPTACYHLYQGALLALQPLLDEYPELQKAIQVGLAQAARAPENERGFVLREVLDKVRDTVKMRKAATLWERLGGEANVKKVVDDFVAAALSDPKVNFLRDGRFDGKVDVNRLKQLLVAQISSVSGGPLKYEGRDMKAVHQGMGITGAEFDALAGHLQAALKKYGVAEADVKAVLDAVGGTRKDIVEK
jgi:hemoglobin